GCTVRRLHPGRRSRKRTRSDGQVGTRRLRRYVRSDRRGTRHPARHLPGVARQRRLRRQHSQSALLPPQHRAATPAAYRETHRPLTLTTTRYRRTMPSTGSPSHTHPANAAEVTSMTSAAAAHSRLMRVAKTVPTNTTINWGWLPPPSLGIIDECDAL